VYPFEHWHTDAADNTVSQTATFKLPGSTLPCYGFTLNSYSRAINPAGGASSNPQAKDWYVDTQWWN
jgi:hypothetical protein